MRQRSQVMFCRFDLLHFLAASLLLVQASAAEDQGIVGGVIGEVEEVVEEVETSLGMLEKAAATAAGTETSGGSGQPLESFCGLSLGDSHVTEPMVVDCSCCTTFMVGDYAAQVELLFGGRRVMATARDKKGAAAGEVPLWSVGASVPDVNCRDGPSGPQAMCNCASQDRTWTEFEPSCEAGPSCKREAPPVEPCSTKAQSRYPVAGSTAASPRAQGNIDGMASCAAAVDDSQNRPGGIARRGDTSIAKRVSIGSARCEDMSAEQCHLFYAKVGDEWRHCKSAVTAVKQCAALTVAQSSATVETARMEAWAVKNAYLPDAWPVDIGEDGTMVASTKPERTELLKHIGNLPHKMSKAYMV